MNSCFFKSLSCGSNFDLHRLTGALVFWQFEPSYAALPLNLYFHCSDIPFKSTKIAIFPAILAPLAHQGLIQACHAGFDKVAMFLGKEIGRIATVGRWFIPLQYLYTYQLVQEFFHPQFFGVTIGIW